MKYSIWLPLISPDQWSKVQPRWTAWGQIPRHLTNPPTGILRTPTGILWTPTEKDWIHTGMWSWINIYPNCTLFRLILWTIALLLALWINLSQPLLCIVIFVWHKATKFRIYPKMIQGLVWYEAPDDLWPRCWPLVWEWPRKPLTHDLAYPPYPPYPLYPPY